MIVCIDTIMRSRLLLCVLAAGAVALLLPLCFVAAATADVEAPVAPDATTTPADAASLSLDDEPADVISWVASLPNLPLLVVRLPFDLLSGSLWFLRHTFLEGGWRSWFGSAHTTHWSGAVFNLALQIVVTFAVVRSQLEAASTPPAGTGLVLVPSEAFATGLSGAVLTALGGACFVFHALGCGWSFSLATWCLLWAGFGWSFLQHPCDSRTVRAYRRGTNIVGAVVIAMVTATRTKETWGINAVFVFLLVGQLLRHPAYTPVAH